jgi:hypothetical protein
MKPEYKKFSIDPQITSFEMLQGILAKAFEIKRSVRQEYAYSQMVSHYLVKVVA